MGKGKKKFNKTNLQETSSTSQTVNPVISPTSVSSTSSDKKKQQGESSGQIPRTQHDQRADSQGRPPGPPGNSPQQMSYAGAGKNPKVQGGPPGNFPQQMSYAGAGKNPKVQAGHPGNSPQRMSYAGAGQRADFQGGPPGPPGNFPQQMSYAAAGQRADFQGGPPGPPGNFPQQMSYAAAGQRADFQGGPPGPPGNFPQQMSYAGAGQRADFQGGPPGPPGNFPQQMSYAAAGQRADFQGGPPGPPGNFPQQISCAGAGQKPVSQPPSQESSSREQPMQEKSQQSSDIEESQLSGKISLTKSSFLIPKRQNQSENARKGERIQIATNHFALTLDLKQSKAFHYDVEIVPNNPKKLFMEIFMQYFQKFFPKNNAAFDGVKNMYSPVPLSLNGKEHTGTISYKEPETNRSKDYNIKIQLASEIDLSKVMKYFTSGSSQEPPQNALQCLDIVLRQPSVRKLTKVGKCFFAPPLNPIDLGGGLDLWYGHFQSVILGWKPFFNLDVAHKGFTKEQNVIYLLDELDESRREKCSQSGWASENTIKNLKRYITNLKVVFQIPNQAASKRIISVKDLAKSPKNVIFELENGKTISVYDYFLREKKYQIKFPDFPCLASGKDKKTCYPLELCTVQGGQSVLLKMDPNQTRNLIKAAATRPQIRQNKIKEIRNRVNLDNDPTVRAFGLSVSKNFETVPARILIAPQLQYGDNQIVPQLNGVWNAAKFFNATKIQAWKILVLDRLHPNAMERFVNELITAGKKLGIQMSQPVIKNINLQDLRQNLKTASTEKMQIVFVIIGGKSKDYSQVKQNAELIVGVLTQCIKRTTVEKINGSTASMILQKVNSKLDSTNHVLSKGYTPNCLKRPCMIVGADVTHPAPSQEGTPSFVGVTASHDRFAYKYNTILKIQPPQIEIISDLEEIMRKQLIYFRQKTSFRPEHIIMFRDGVSEGQFQQVLQSELTAIRAACKSLEQGYEPAITMFIVQKRHHTRFFPTDKHCDRNSNPLPGTCVDSQITHPTELDFYLLSHASIQGTARPTRYHCIWDDANMLEDEVEHLTYYLCHLYTRCTRTVSYPTPTYYAHLAAARAKVLFDGEEFSLEDIKQHQNKLTICEKIVNNNPMFFV